MASLTQDQTKEFLNILKTRFEKNTKRHPDISWSDLESKLINSPQKLNSLYLMESTGGEPDVVAFEQSTQNYMFVDCSPESPIGRRSLCYDQEALEKRKENKPKDSALNMASKMGIAILNEQDYKYLQKLGKFDTKTSSWIETPSAIRKLGGALFGDCRYDHVFIYHNGADSYYAARGFRGKLYI
jgi:hypothetical protein